MRQHFTLFRHPITPWVILFAALPASYWPLLQLGQTSGVHIDIAFLYLVVLGVVIGQLPTIWQERQLVWQSWIWRLLVGFAAWSTVSLLWTANLPRGIFTVGFVWLLLALVSALIVHYPLIVRRASLLQKVAVYSIGLVAVVSLWQIFGDALGVSPLLTLLPQAYQADVFGVARPVALALEPQFLASLLLAPIVIICSKIFHGPQKRYVYVILALLLTLLIVTLSRGGLFAAAVAIGVLLLQQRPTLKSVAAVLITGLVSCMVAAALIVSAGQLYASDNRSGYDTLRASVSQLSFNTIRLPTLKPASTESRPSSRPAKPARDYAVKSTTSRLDMTEVGLTLWASSPVQAVTGSGSGSFGARLAANNRDYPEETVVNNYYVETLVETGLIGVALLLAAFGLLVRQLIKARAFCLAALLLGFFAQWWFFSGNANVIHIWVAIGLALGTLSARKL